jgi:hypothetical protein
MVMEKELNNNVPTIRDTTPSEWDPRGFMQRVMMTQHAFCLLWLEGIRYVLNKNSPQKRLEIWHGLTLAGLG